jgi:1-hydroxycarotenoid 3,4-desaturase
MRASFAALGRDDRIPDEPTVYVCAQDRSERAGPAAEDPQRVLILINAPPRGGQGRFTAPEIDACQHATLQLLRRCGLEVTMDPSATSATTPNEFAAMFPGTGGALYGSATRGWTDSLTRHGARTKLAGLYLAGGQRAPGSGLADGDAERALRGAERVRGPRFDRGWRPAGTVGGTSTRSATTVATG